MPQLRDLGVSRHVVALWLADGRLHRLHRGVYAVGHTALTLRSRELAAVFASGPRAVRAHRSAAAAYDLARATHSIEVTAPRSRGHHSGFALHTSRSLERHDATEVQGIPTTTVARTIVDCAEVCTQKQLAKIVHEAEVQQLFDLNRIREVQSRLPGRRGRHLLNRVLADYEPSPRLTRSEGERRLLELCENHGLPLPETQVAEAGYELDCLWRHARLAVEFDGRTTHDNTKAFYSDRLRDRKLKVIADIEVIRVTRRDLEPDPTDVLADLSRLLL